ncbi:MAG: hypothetical protein ABI728_14380 [Betaproteobacteria bacterium]
MARQRLGRIGLRSPLENTSCQILPRIGEGKGDAVEVREEVTGNPVEPEEVLVAPKRVCEEFGCHQFKLEGLDGDGAVVLPRLQHPDQRPQVATISPIRRLELPHFRPWVGFLV